MWDCNNGRKVENFRFSMMNLRGYSSRHNKKKSRRERKTQPATSAEIHSRSSSTAAGTRFIPTTRLLHSKLMAASLSPRCTWVLLRVCWSQPYFHDPTLATNPFKSFLSGWLLLLLLLVIFCSACLMHRDRWVLFHFVCSNQPTQSVSQSVPKDEPGRRTDEDLSPSVWISFSCGKTEWVGIKFYDA